MYKKILIALDIEGGVAIAQFHQAQQLLHDRALDPMLPLLVLSTFAFALLGGIGALL